MKNILLVFLLAITFNAYSQTTFENDVNFRGNLKMVSSKIFVDTNNYGRIVIEQISNQGDTIQLYIDAIHSGIYSENSIDLGAFANRFFNIWYSGNLINELQPEPTSAGIDGEIRFCYAQNFPNAVRIYIYKNDEWHCFEPIH